MAFILKRFVLLFGLWLALTSGDPSAWIVGALVAATATALSLRLQPVKQHGVNLLTVLRLAPSFLWGSLLGGLDVARRAFHPRLPLRPGWIAYPVRLPPGAPRVSLGNELSLMPGTLAAGSHADTLYVHCLDADRAIEADIEAEERKIAESIGMNLEQRHG